MDNTREIILHNHIYKNAGTSIDLVFENSNIFVTNIENENFLGVSEHDISQIIRANPSLEVITSHTLLKDAPLDTPDIRYIDLLCIRHPINRLLSMYKYEIKGKKKYSFLDFINVCIKSRPYDYFSCQTTRLGAFGQFYFPPNEMIFDLAVSRILKCRFLMTVEQLKIGFQTFKKLNPTLKISRKIYIPDVIRIENSSFKDLFNDEAKRHALKNEIGDDRYNKILLDNNWDVELYEAASKELLRRYFA